MNTINKTLVDKIQAGTHAIEHNGTLEQLREVLKECFPDSIQDVYGTYKYYLKTKKPGFWTCCNKTFLDTIPVTDFFIEDWQPKWGEKVEISMDGINDWKEATYIGKYPDLEDYHVSKLHENNSIRARKYVRKVIPKLQLTRQQIADKFGIEISQFEII